MIRTVAAIAMLAAQFAPVTVASQPAPAPATVPTPTRATAPFPTAPATATDAPGPVRTIPYDPIPRPAPPPRVGSRAFERQMEERARRLAERCMSPAGIAIVQQAYLDREARQQGDPPQWQVHEDAVADAIWATPFDPAVLRSALVARAEFRAEREREMAAHSIGILDRLNPEDQQILAQGMTSKRPISANPPSCKVAR